MVVVEGEKEAVLVCIVETMAVPVKVAVVGTTPAHEHAETYLSQDKQAEA